jgi:hypothetical protein
MAKKQNDGGEIFVVKVEVGILEVCIKGVTPLIMNRMSEKVRQGLLLPKGKKNAAEKAGSAKHNPLVEYRDSAYKLHSPGNTLLYMPAGAFKRALASAAVDMPGAAKAQIGRLAHVAGAVSVPIYGVPQLRMAVVRSADQKRTPDVHTNAVLPEWACVVSFQYVMPILREQAIANLATAAGMYIGIGDGRSEKGILNFGQFELVSKDDADFKRIIKNGGRVAQEKAIESPGFFDDESADLFNWSQVELRRRGFAVAA